MKRNGKILGTLVIACSFVFSAWSQNTETANLLKEWSIYGNAEAKTTIIQPDGIFACENKMETDGSGVVQKVHLDQKEAKTISFSAESKAENVSGMMENNTVYAIYLDIVYNDDTKQNGVTANFTPGTHDWEKVARTFTPEKPIKLLRYYMLFRNKTGKAWFRNAVLTEDVAKK